MPWTRPTLAELITRIENDITSRMTGNAPLLRKAMLKILARVWAGLNHILYGLIENEATNILITTSTGDRLDQHAADRGITRLPATAATGSAVVTGVNGTVISQGTILVADSGVEFQTTAVGTIVSGTATIPIICLTFGDSGNLPAAATLTFQLPLDNIDETGETAAAITDGYEQETDDELRARILAKITNPPAGGSRADFIRWAKEASSGVGDAWCFPNYYGAGTVAVVIKATDASPGPSGGLISTVQTYLDRDDIRPVTMDPTVVGVDPQPVVFTLNISPDTAEARTAIQNNLRSLLEKDVAPGGNGGGTDILYISHIRKEIAVANILDYTLSAMTIDGNSVSVTANFQFTSFGYPVFSSITWT